MRRSKLNWFPQRWLSEFWYLDLNPIDRLILMTLYLSIDQISGVFHLSEKKIAFHSGCDTAAVAATIRNLLNSPHHLLKYDESTKEVFLTGFIEFSYKNTDSYEKAIRDELRDVQSNEILSFIRSKNVSRRYKTMIDYMLREHTKSSSTTQPSEQTESELFTTPSPTSIEEGSNEREEENVVLSAVDNQINWVFETMSKHWSTSFRTKDDLIGSKAARRQVSARINEKYSGLEMLAVVLSRRRHWINNDKMRHHLDPTTVFREGNFEKYLRHWKDEIADSFASGTYTLKTMIEGVDIPDELATKELMNEVVIALKLSDVRTRIEKAFKLVSK